MLWVGVIFVILYFKKFSFESVLAVCLPDDPDGNAKLMLSILDCLPRANRVSHSNFYCKIPLNITIPCLTGHLSISVGSFVACSFI